MTPPPAPPSLGTRGAMILPVLLIAIGTGWLLTVRHVLPGVDWAWVLLLGVTGALVLAIGGFTRTSLFVGLFLIICSGASLLRQTGRLEVDTEVPALTIVAGVLMVVVRIAPAKGNSPS